MAKPGPGFVALILSLAFGGCVSKPLGVTGGESSSAGASNPLSPVPDCSVLMCTESDWARSLREEFGLHKISQNSELAQTTTSSGFVFWTTFYSGHVFAFNLSSAAFSELKRDPGRCVREIRPAGQNLLFATVSCSGPDGTDQTFATWSPRNNRVERWAVDPLGPGVAAYAEGFDGRFLLLS